MPAQRPAYTTDVSDEEWQILAPLLPPEKPGGDPVSTRCARYSMASRMCGVLAVPGA
jgi:transposase